MSILEWPNALRNAGLSVYERAGWQSIHPLGLLPSRVRKIYWHHDGSPVGPSPGAWEWITSSYDSKQPSAQLWMDYSGQWRFVGAGVAYHAGTTVDSTDWNTTVGLETDHTIGEPYSPVMLDSLHRGFAAIAKVEGRNADFMTFHKIEARPLGRKVDPYLSLNHSPDDQSTWWTELNEHRAIIQNIIDNGQPLKPTETPKPLEKDEDMLAYIGCDPNENKVNDREGYYLVGMGVWIPSPSGEVNDALVAAGLAKPFKIVSGRQFDLLRDWGKNSASYNQAGKA